MKKKRDFLESQDISVLCDEHCPLECDTTSYSLNLNSAYYPTIYYWNVIRNQPNIIQKTLINTNFTPGYILDCAGQLILATNETNLELYEGSEGNPSTTSDSQLNTSISKVDVSLVKSSILKISIFYDDLRYTNVEEAPSIDFITLIGVVGGQFGNLVYLLNFLL